MPGYVSPRLETKPHALTAAGPHLELVMWLSECLILLSIKRGKLTEQTRGVLSLSVPTTKGNKRTGKR